MLVQFPLAMRSQPMTPSPQLAALMQRLYVLCAQLLRAILQLIVDQYEHETTVSSPPRDESRKIRRLAEIEAKILQQLTAHLVKVRPSKHRRSRRSNPASRPPSPQLFAISEEECSE